MQWQMRKELDQIAAFEHRRLSELVREWMGDKIEGYNKRPDYKRYLKIEEEKKERERKKSESSLQLGSFAAKENDSE